METKQLTLHVVAVHAAKTLFLFENFWSALAKAPISASAGAKEATNSTENCCHFVLLLSFVCVVQIYYFFICYGSYCK